MIKQPLLAYFNLKRLSNDQDGLSLSTSGENTDACSSLIQDMHGLQKRKHFQSSWLSQLDWLRSDEKIGTMHCMTCENDSSSSNSDLSFYC